MPSQQEKDRMFEEVKGDIMEAFEAIRAQSPEMADYPAILILTLVS